MIHHYLLARCEHAQKCSTRACAQGCGYRSLREWLATPLFEWDRRADARRQSRLDLLLRGEVPAA